MGGGLKSGHGRDVGEVDDALVPVSIDRKGRLCWSGVDIGPGIGGPWNGIQILASGERSLNFTEPNGISDDLDDFPPSLGGLAVNHGPLR